MSTQPAISPSYRPPGKPVDARKILGRHRPFLVVAALALGGLIAIEVWGTAQLAPARPAAWSVLWGGLAVVVTIIGNGIALLLPPRWVKPDKYPRPVGAFAEATGLGAAITALTFALDYVLLLTLASFDLESAVMLLKDLYFYALTALVLVHGLLYYVRQMHWVYEEFGGADSPFKVIGASGGFGALILIVTLVFFPLDVQSIAAAAPEMHGIMGLFIYGRDLYLLTFALGVYVWHFRWIADH